MTGSHVASTGEPRPVLSQTPLDDLTANEWLVTNGLGGYACSTAPGLNTRKYHGLLVAAMSPPVRRMVLLAKVEETVVDDGWPVPLSCNEYPGVIHPQGYQSLVSFERAPNPKWTYQGRGWTLIKELQLVPGENTVCLRYTLVDATKPVELNFRPLFAMRSIHELMYQWNGRLEAERWEGYEVPTRMSQARREKEHKQHVVKTARDWRIPATTRTPEVFFSSDGAFAPGHGVWYLNTIYRCEEQRGYSGLEDLWNPGEMRWKLQPGATATFVCSTDPIEFERVGTFAGASRSVATGIAQIGTDGAVPSGDKDRDALLRAAEQFLVSTDDATAVVSQYPWSPPNTRAALIGFTGVFLVPGKFDYAKRLITQLLGQLDEGLVPSEFPESGAAPIYRAADVSLWLVHAIAQYHRYTHDEKSLRVWFDKVLEIIEQYRHGTRLGITTDAEGLLTSHEPGQGTTWMDAKVGEWVVTQRQGNAVELCALWYNALRTVAAMASHLGQDSRAGDLNKLADRAKVAFNKRFWHEAANCCYDVIDEHGVDPTIRPNQLLAVSLPYPILDIERHEKVLDTIATELLTPLGLRTLSAKDPSYQGKYRGNVVERDRAQHQGSVYPWLLGPWVSSYLKLHGRGAQARTEARQFLDSVLRHLHERGSGQLCELFDGDAPHNPGGAIASALSVAEILRAYVEDIEGNCPDPPAPIATLAPTIKPVIRPVVS